MAMTYEQLGEKIARMTPEQRQADVSVHLNSTDDFQPVDHLELNNAEQEDDRLEDGHPVLIVLDGIDE